LKSRYLSNRGEEEEGKKGLPKSRLAFTGTSALSLSHYKILEDWFILEN
jgi:hypothetical protein